MRGAKARHKWKPCPVHFSDSSLYNLVLNNTVIIVYKLMISSPILCYLNAQFGYETSDASNSIPPEEKQMDYFLCKNANGLLVYGVYIYTVSVLLYVCRLISRKIIASPLARSSSARKGSSLLSVLPMNEWMVYVSFLTGNTTAPGGPQVHSSVSF